MAGTIQLHVLRLPHVQSEPALFSRTSHESVNPNLKTAGPLDVDCLAEGSSARFQSWLCGAPPHSQSTCPSDTYVRPIVEPCNVFMIERSVQIKPLHTIHPPASHVPCLLAPYTDQVPACLDWLLMLVLVRHAGHPPPSQNA